MVSSQSKSDRIEQLLAAFQKDSFQVDRQKDVFVIGNKIGMRATHQYATIGSTGKKKKAFYVEGDYRRMGRLMGLMAESEIAQMCAAFNRDIISAFIHPDVQKDRALKKAVTECLKLLLEWVSNNMFLDIRYDFKNELRGILAGCHQANPNTRIGWQELWILNVGIDILLSRVYTGKFTVQDRELPFKLEPNHLRAPVLCNSFSVFGSAVENDGHFFGRDFAFPTGNVFQDTAALVIQNPTNRQPFVSVTAPGIIGSITGMNVKGVGVGVNMAPSGNCTPASLGLNSLLLARYCVERADSCQNAVNAIVNNTRHGVPWLYTLADGTNQRACVVETGCVIDDPGFLDYPPENLKKHLPSQDFLNSHRSTEFKRGTMVRWSDYKYPTEYLEFNPALFEYFNKRYAPADFAETGYIAKSWRDRHCPSAYYFAPQRETLDNLILATNMYTIPEMRLYAMHYIPTIVAAGHYDDMQWRYDALNDELVSRIKGGDHPITFEEAKSIIDFLAPYARYPDYNNPNGKPLEQVQIPGAVSLMDLRERKITSHYGYYADEWVTIHLSNYVKPWK